jgi:hypothetical protein
VGGKSVIVGETDGIQPELGFAIIPLDMNVRRLVALMGLKVKPIATFSQNGGHILFLTGSIEVGKTGVHASLGQFSSTASKCCSCNKFLPPHPHTR